MITGLPRSGSTLLCNILNQNPNNMASGTSVLGGAVNAISQSISSQPEVSSMDYETIKKSTVSFIESWHGTDKVVFDKGRAWSHMGLIFNDLKLGKMYVLVRDLRDVYASMEKQHRKNPMLANENIIGSTGIFQRADKMFSEEGMIGICVAGIEDLIRRNLPNVVFIRYEGFVADPASIMKTIDDFDYQFDDVVNVSKEKDSAYHDKFPHEGSGKVTTKSIGMWTKYLDNDLAKNIKEKFPLYNQTFGY